jgi:hypothetical protein
MGSSNFTIELWIYPTTTGSPGRIINNWSTSTQQSASWEILQAGGGVQFNCSTAGTTSEVSLNGGGLNINGWNHLAGVRIGNVFTLYVNGTSASNTTQAITLQTADSFTIGARSNQGNYGEYFTGYISNVRVVKGTGLYTTGFTPSTIPLSTVTNMSLLTCRSATATDVSTNNLTITSVGSPVISNTNTPFSFASIITPNTYYKQIPSVSSTTKQTTELTSLDNTTINTSSLSIQLPNQKYIPTVSSTTKQTTELTSLDSTNNYTTTASALIVGKKQIPTVPSVTRVSTFIKTAEDPISDSAAAAAASTQTWYMS